MNPELIIDEKVFMVTKQFMPTYTNIFKCTELHQGKVDNISNNLSLDINIILNSFIIYPFTGDLKNYFGGYI